MGRGKLEAWQTSGMANQRNRSLKKSWQTRGVANLVIENAGKLEGVANQWHACPPNSVLYGAYASSRINLKFVWKALNKIYPDPNFAVAEDIKNAFDAIAKVRD